MDKTSDIPMPVEQVELQPTKEDKRLTPLSLCRLIRKDDLQMVYPNLDIALRMFVSTAVSNCSAERAQTVSYTHLDVYKRQVYV